MLKRILSVICVIALIGNIPIFAFADTDNGAYLLNESFDGAFVKDTTNPNLIIGGSIKNIYNYRDKTGNTTVNEIVSDNVKTNYLKQYFASNAQASSDWRGVFLDVENPTENEYQLIKFDFRMSSTSNGLWVQVSSAFKNDGGNTGSKAVILHITKSLLRLRSKDSSRKDITLSDYGLPSDLSTNESWHNVKIIMDNERFTYDVMIDDILVAADVTAAQDIAAWNSACETNFDGKGVHKVERIFFSAQGKEAGSYVGIDNVKISDLTASDANNIIKGGLDKLFAYSEIYSDSFPLPFAGSLGANSTDGESKISYTSDNTENVRITDTHYSNNAVGETGLSFSDMPQEGENDIEFNLTVKLKRPVKGGEEATAEFSYPLTLSYMTDEKKAQRDKHLLCYSDLIQCDNNQTSVPEIVVPKIVLPLTGANGTEIFWSSSHPDIISTDGVVTKSSADTVVTLTADFGYGITKDFDFYVAASVKAKIIADEEATYRPASVITESFNLPHTGELYSSNITWTIEPGENNFAIILKGTKALVSRPSYGEEDAEVSLKAVYTLEGEYEEFVYDVTVPAMESASDEDEEFDYMIHQTFDGEYTPDEVNTGILIGDNISSYYNYRGGRANASKNTIESDSVKTNYFKQSLLSNSESSNWRGIYFDLDSTPRGEYQLFEFDFKLSEKSSGLWVQVCDDNAKDSGNNTGQKFVMFSINKSKLYLRNSSTSFKNIDLVDYGLSNDLTKAGGWHNIKVVMDTKRFVYDILIDDCLIAADVVSAGDPSALIENKFLVERLYFSAQGNADGSYVGLDDIKLSCISAKKANSIVKKGFDTLFASTEIYKSSMLLPFSGMHGLYPAVNGEAKIDYASSNNTNVVITNTHYCGGSGDTRLDFVDVPSSENDADIPFKLFVRLERPSEEGAAISAFEYDFKLAYLTDIKKVNLDASLMKYTDLTGENPQSLVSDLTLPLTGANGSMIVWSTNGKDDIISPETGKVTRGNNDTEVILTATFTAGQATATAQFPFIVKQSVKGKIIEDEAQFIKPDFNNITSDFTIPLKGAINNSLISWTSDNASVFIKGNKALVTRPEYVNGDADVTLTAKYVLDFEEMVFNYTLTVKKELSDEESVQKAYDALDFSDISIENENAVTMNLSLLSVLDYGAECVWETDGVYIKEDGSVFPPLNTTENVTVALSAIISKGNAAPLRKSFNVTIRAFPDEQAVADRAKSLLTFNLLSEEGISEVTKSLTLPKKGFYDSDISWSSNNSDALFVTGTTGMVIRPQFGNGDAAVTLKATIRYGDALAEKTFFIKVLEDSGYEVVFSSDFEHGTGTVGGAVTVDGIGKARFENPDRGTHETAYDPISPTNIVAKLTRNADVSTSCTVTYLTKLGSQHFSTDELTVNTKLYIPSDVGHSLWYYICAYDSISGGLSPIVLIDFAPDGSVKFNYVLSGTPLELVPIDFSYEHDKWFELQIKGNTYSKMYDVYIDGIKINENGKVFVGANLANPFDTSLGRPFYYSDSDSPSNFYAIRLRHEGAASTEPRSIYFDDISVERKVQYSPSMDRAMEEFRIKFLAENPINSIYKDIVFPNINIEGVDIEYFPDDENIVTKDGRVNFTDKEQNTSILIKFTGNSGSVAYSAYNLVIVAENDPVFKAQMTDSQRVEEDLKYVISYLKDKYNLSNITSNLDLKKQAKNGSQVIYSSSNTEVLTDDGKIIRSKDDVSVTLDITVKFRETVQNGKIDIVIKKNVTNMPSGGSPGGSSGGGSYGGTTGSFAGGTGNAAQTGVSSSNKPFTDVENDFWAIKEIAKLKELNVISGTGDGSFNPSASVKREEFVKMLVSVLNPETVGAEKEFNDLDKNAWYYPYIIRAAQAGIAGGYEDGSFGIGNAITRQDLAVMIYNSMKGKDGFNELHGDVFADDSDIADYAKKAVYAMRANGLMKGKGNNLFDPRAYVTRAEAAVVIYRIMD